MRKRLILKICAEVTEWLCFGFFGFAIACIIYEEKVIAAGAIIIGLILLVIGFFFWSKHDAPINKG